MSRSQRLSLQRMWSSGFAVLLVLLIGIVSGVSADTGETQKSFQERYGRLPARIRLQLALQEGNLAAVKRALGGPVTVDAKQMGFPVMRLAINGGNPEVVQYVLARGANPNHLMEYGEASIAALALALIKYGTCWPCSPSRRARYREMIEVILDFGGRFPADGPPEPYAHPLKLAGSACDVDLVRRLLRSDLMVGLEKTGKPPIDVGCMKPKMLHLLRRHGAKFTPEFIDDVLDDVDAAWKARLAHWLLDEGVDPAKYEFVRMALYWNDYDLLKRALRNGGSADRYIKADLTFPLAYAVQYGDVRAVRILLNAGAQADRTNYKGTPLIDVARNKGYSAVAKLLAQHLSNPIEQ